MKSVLPFASLIVVGLLGSLHSLPPERHSSVTPEQEVRDQDSLTLVAGIIEAIDPHTQTITLKTDQGRIILLRVNNLHACSRAAIGTQVYIRMDRNDADWATTVSSQGPQARM